MRKLDDYLMIKHTPNGREFPYLDCWGLVCDVYREYLDIELSEYTSLTHKTMSQGFSQERQSGNFIEVTEPRNFDIVAFFYPWQAVSRWSVFRPENPAHVRKEELQIRGTGQGKSV